MDGSSLVSRIDEALNRNSFTESNQTAQNQNALKMTTGEAITYSPLQCLRGIDTATKICYTS